MKKIVQSFSVLLASLFLTTSLVAAQGQYTSGTTGVDVGWPNCSSSLPTVTFGIVGVSNGTGYSTNPCLGRQANHFVGNLSLYVNTGWNSASTYVNPSSPRQCAAGDNNCLAYNYGYNAGLYAANAATTASVSSSTWWLDVETSNTWNTDVIQNQQSLLGEHDALIAKGASTVGIYSTTAQWKTIAGGWQNNWPSWGATTWTSATQAQTYCTGHQFTGGSSYLMQYKSKHSSFDQDIAC